MTELRHRTVQIAAPKRPISRAISVWVSVVLATACSEASTAPEPVANRAPVASAVASAAAAAADGPTALVPDSMEVGDTVIAVVGGLFSDPDGDALTYRATSSQPRVLQVSMRHDTLFLAALERGSATVAIRATDPGGQSASVSFRVKVVGSAPELVAGLPEHPFTGMTVGGNEGSTATVGTLRLGLNPHAFPVIAKESESWLDVLVAGSQLGDGRVVAFSGQDFLGPDDRATLLGHANADRLVANAVRWAARDDTVSLRVLVDNPRVARALEGQGLEGIEVVGTREWQRRDWGAGALDDVDVAVVLTNHWGTETLIPEFVPSLRPFVQAGGGLVIAGSALHWDWWIRERHGPFIGNAVLEGSGISWNVDAIDEIESASTAVDARMVPGLLWGAYIAGESLDASLMARLPGLFNTALQLGRTAELDSALVRVVREAPSLPTPSSAPEARLAALVAETLGLHEWPEIHPWATVFPGLPAESARRIEGTVTIDAGRSGFPADASRRERHLPLGYYAPPGALVTIEVPPIHASGELLVSVGELHDNLGAGHSAQSMWRRAPLLRREFAVTKWQTGVTNAYGGSIALVVPADYERGRVPVTVRGAIPMAVYTDGESNASAWFADLDAGAPQAIIQKPGGIRLVISTENARGVEDPGEVSAFWSGFYRHHAELSGEPVPRAFESIWIFDPQVGWGYANASWLRINYPLHAEHWALVPGTADGRRWLGTLPNEGPTRSVVPPSTGYSPRTHGVDWWLFGHELGHQWQTADWGYSRNTREIIEVAVNLFSMYTLGHYVFGGDDSDLYTEPWPTTGCGLAAAVDHAALPYKPWHAADLCEKLFLYRQLIFEFGWDPIRRVFRSYYDEAYPRSRYSGELDGFAIRFSAIVKRDLVSFFRRWEYPLSESAAGTIRSFGFAEWLPPGW